MNKLLICENTRKIATDTLKLSLEKLLTTNKPISEVDLHDIWLLELRKHKDIFLDGWYIPPPNGIAVIFGTEKDYSRINFTSIRPEEFWPKENSYLDFEHGFAMVYASPVDRKTGIIGDFEMTLYFGKDSQIENHLKINLEIIRDLFAYAQIGMSLEDVSKKGLEIIREKGLSNSVFSINDPTSTNIGHTIPFSYEEMNRDEKIILNNANTDWKAVCKMISKKRRFVNNEDELRIIPGMAFTIEPRIKNSKDLKIPLASYHTIVLFHTNGEKELLTGFDEIFKLTGMNYMLKK